MKKNIIVILTAAFVLFISCSAFAATNSDIFADVPSTHWSYQAVAYLAKAGIIDGDNGRFLGDKPMTRYEMAQVVFKALQNESKATLEQKALIDKLAAEYALEMNRINAIDDRLTKVEHKQNFQFSGSILERWKVVSMDHSGKSPAGNASWAGLQQKFSLNISARIDDNTTAYARIANPALSNTKFKDSTTNKAGDYKNTTFAADRFFTVTKLNADNSLTLGRQPLTTDPEDLLVDSTWFQFDGVKFTGNVGIFNYDVKHGRFYAGLDPSTTYGLAPNRPISDFNSADIDYVKIGSQVNKWTWDAAYFRLFNPNISDHTLTKYNFGDAYYSFNDKLTVGGIYGKNTTAPSGKGAFYLAKAIYGIQSLAKPGQQNFTVTYINSETYGVNEQFCSWDFPVEETEGHGFTDFDLAYRFALSKSSIVKLQWGRVRDTDDSRESYDVCRAQIQYKF